MTKTMTAAAALLAGLGTPASAAAQDLTADDVRASHYPYEDGVPSFEGLEPGMTIDQSNWEAFAEVIDPAMQKAIVEGMATITVGETTSFALHDSYVAATQEHLNTARLGDAPGQLVGYVAGRPFPGQPSADDPDAGRKLAFNFKYGYNFGDGASIDPFVWKYRDMKTGKVERELKWSFHFLKLMHRTTDAPVPAFDSNPSDIYRGTYAIVQEPFDVKNTQLLIQRYDDDTKRDDAWLYLGFQRRVRRLATGQITDSFLGSDNTVEDFEGYNGRISDMDWRYKGDKLALLPFYNHNDMDLSDEGVDGFNYVDFEGQGGCFPAVTWQLRKVAEVEAVPIDEGHPLSKRLYYYDYETATLARTVMYDRKGALWKTQIVGQSHSDHHLPTNLGKGVPLDDSASVIDFQSQRCTTLQFRSRTGPEFAERDLFTVQNLRTKGR